MQAYNKLGSTQWNVSHSHILRKDSVPFPADFQEEVAARFGFFRVDEDNMRRYRAKAK